MITVTILFSVFGVLAFLGSAVVLSDGADGSFLAKTAVFLWFMTLSIGLFVVAAHPWWVAG